MNATVEGVESKLARSSRKPYSGNQPTISGNAIVLTNKSKKEIENIDRTKLETSVVGLAELHTASDIYGVAMFISPATYIFEILALNPKVSEVVFFYDTRRYSPIETESLSKEFDVSIESYGVDSMGEALAAIAEGNRLANPHRALVFTRGFIEISESTLLDFIVRQTWDSRALTVANKPSHIKAGLVLGVLPDFFGYGEQIGELYINAEATNFSEPRIEYLESTIGAINVRTAGRLGLDVAPKSIARFELSYPSK